MTCPEAQPRGPLSSTFNPTMDETSAGKTFALCIFVAAALFITGLVSYETGLTRGRNEVRGQAAAAEVGTWALDPVTGVRVFEWRD